MISYLDDVHPMLSWIDDWHDVWSLERLIHFSLHIGGGVWILMSQGAFWCITLGVREL